jgi:hypothetical protein
MLGLLTLTASYAGRVAAPEEKAVQFLAFLVQAQCLVMGCCAQCLRRLQPQNRATGFGRSSPTGAF